MSMVVFSSATVKNFVDNGEEFNKYINEQFAALDSNGDGVLSRAELRKGFDSLGLLETELATGGSLQNVGDLFDAVFEKFDADRSGNVDLEEFRKEMKEFMLAMASGIGDQPIQVALEDGSLLKRAVDFENSKK